MVKIDKMTTTTKNEIKTCSSKNLLFRPKKTKYIFFHDQTNTQENVFRYRTTIVTVIISKKKIETEN